MKEIYIDDLQIHDWMDNTIGYNVFADIQGLEGPDVRISTYNKPGEHGAHISNVLYGGRLVTLSGRVFANDLVTFNQRRRALQQAFKIEKDSNSITVPHTLKFTTTDDIELQTSCVIQSPMKMALTNLLDARWQVDLFCPDFYLEGQSERTEGILVESGGGFILPVIFPIVFEAKVGGSAILNNQGTSEFYPSILLNGKLTNPVITNLTTGRYMELTKTLLAVDSDIVIDMKNKTVLQGTTPILSTIVVGSSWWWLEPGENNITLTTDDSADTGNIQITYRDSYLGI